MRSHFFVWISSAKSPSLQRSLDINLWLDSFMAWVLPIGILLAVVGVVGSSCVWSWVWSQINWGTAARTADCRLLQVVEAELSIVPRSLRQVQWPAGTISKPASDTRHHTSEHHSQHHRPASNHRPERNNEVAKRTARLQGQLYHHSICCDNLSARWPARLKFW